MNTKQKSIANRNKFWTGVKKVAQVVSYPSSKKESLRDPPGFFMIWIASKFVLPYLNDNTGMSETNHIALENEFQKAAEMEP